jgi:hypothetical protein
MASAEYGSADAMFILIRGVSPKTFPVSSARFQQEKQ